MRDLHAEIDFLLGWRRSGLLEGGVEAAGLPGLVRPSWVAAVMRAFQHVLRKPIKAEKPLRTDSIAPRIAVKLRTFRKQPSASRVLRADKTYGCLFFCDFLKQPCYVRTFISR